MQEVSQVIDNPLKHGEFNFRKRRELGRRLSGQDYQYAYVMPNSWKSALIPFFADIPLRIGYTGEARFWLLNQRQPAYKEPSCSMVQHFWRLATSDDMGEESTAAILQPVLQSSSQQQQVTLQAMQLSTDHPVYIFCPGAEYGAAKRWPAEHFAALAVELLNADANSVVWLLGSEKDGVEARRIVAALPAGISPQRCLDLCGQTMLTQAVDLLAVADLVVCNDSGLMHIAAAVNTPVVAIYGSSSPVFTPPLSKHAQIVSLRLECSPCFKRECPLGTLACLQELLPGQVLAACNDALLSGQSETD